MTTAGGWLGQRKLVLTLAALLSVLGLVSWRTMTRQEDPRLPEYWGQVVATFPGADAETVERLVLEPVEDRLAQVDELKEIVSTARAELAVLELELRNDIDDADRGWDRVREALRDVRAELPEGVAEPRLEDRQQDQESVVLALTGHPDPLALAAAAEVLQDELLAVPAVAEVRRIADPGEQITIELDDAAARRLGISPQALAAQLAARTKILPGGSLAAAGRSVSLRPASEFASVEEIRNTTVLLPSGETVPLSAVAPVRRGPEEPARARMRTDGQTAVGLGVVPRKSINVVDFGRAVRARVAEVAPRLAPIEIREVAFQPARVAARLSQLNRSLLAAALIVAGILVLAMGLRPGLLVAAVVPLVTLTSLAIFALGGGVLHQISIAAVVIALGMLVDNAIVVAENLQGRLDGGATPGAAARGAVRELAVPLAGATATTLAAFVPMLLAPGATADFTRSIPAMIMLTLSVSYLFALFVTPVLGERFLAGRAGAGEGVLERLAGAVAGVAIRRPGRVLVAAALAVGLSFAAFPLVRQEFFPSSDRNQLVIDVKLPEGSHLDATDAAAARLERALLARPEVTAVAGFIGRSAPHFYYNLPQIPWSPHFAQVVVETSSTAVLDAVAGWARDFADRELPEAEVVVRKLEQGPPVAAPVELRLYGRELADLETAAELWVAELRRVPGTADVRHDLSLASPVLRFEIDDAAAARRGLTRATVATALYGATRGWPVGQFRGGDDPVPVVVRSAAGEHFPAGDLPALDVTAPDGTPVPLAQVARIDAAWRPGEIHHRGRRRVVTVSSQLAPRVTSGEVVAALAPRLAAVGLPPGVEVSLGGDAEGSGEANSAMLRTLPVGVLLLLAILMAEFRSFRRVGIVLITVPLSAAGVVPGLLAGDQAFGFMSLLGVMALAGIVVNNAIVLLEVVEARRREGATIPVAVADAVRRRVRPIVLTTATTVAGLLPLALSPSTLWPPMAWAMISGLLASALLTLLVVPALYLLLFEPSRVFRPFRDRRPQRTAQVAETVLALALLPAGGLHAAEPSAAASPAGTAAVADLAFAAPAVLEPPTSEEGGFRLTLAEAMARGARRPAVRAAQARADAARREAVAARRAALWPSLAVNGGLSERAADLALTTPIGKFPFGNRRSESADATVVQPLLAAERFYSAPAAATEARAIGFDAVRTGQQAAAAAAEAFLDVLGLDARLRATEAFIASLETALAETEARVAEGRSLEADALKVRLALDAARQDRREIAAARRVAALALGHAVGLDGAAEPVWDEARDEGVFGIVNAEVVDLGQVVETALAARPDLTALRQRIAAQGLRRKAVEAERWPRLEAVAGWTWTSGSPYDRESWAEGALRLRWSPFAAGTRGPRAAAAQARLEALEAEYAEQRRAVELALRAALAELDTARGALMVGESGVVQASETLRVEQERHRAGRITTNDLLAAEATLRDRRTVRDLAALAVVRAGVRFELAVGTAGAAAKPE